MRGLLISVCGFVLMNSKVLYSIKPLILEDRFCWLTLNDTHIHTVKGLLSRLGGTGGKL